VAASRRHLRTAGQGQFARMRTRERRPLIARFTSSLVSPRSSAKFATMGVGWSWEEAKLTALFPSSSTRLSIPRSRAGSALLRQCRGVLALRIRPLVPDLRQRSVSSRICRWFASKECVNAAWTVRVDWSERIAE